MPDLRPQPDALQIDPMTEVMNLLEIEPTNAPPAASPINIPALREELAILVSTRKCKEAIGMSFSQDEVKRLDTKDVQKYHKRYEAYVGSKTTDSMVENFLSLAIKAAGLFVKIDNENALKAEFKNDFNINKELSQFFGGLTLKFGGTAAAFSSLLITAKHVDISGEVIPEQITEQSSVITQELVNNTE